MPNTDVMTPPCNEFCICNMPINLSIAAVTSLYIDSRHLIEYQMELTETEFCSEFILRRFKLSVIRFRVLFLFHLNIIQLICYTQGVLFRFPLKILRLICYTHGVVLRFHL